MNSDSFLGVNDQIPGQAHGCRPSLKLAVVFIFSFSLPLLILTDMMVELSSEKKEMLQKTQKDSLKRIDFSCKKQKSTMTLSRQTPFSTITFPS